MGKIATAQTNLIALLTADVFFQDNTDPANPVVLVPIVNKQQGDIQSQLEEALTNLGVGVVVILRRARLLEPDDHFGIALDCQFAVTAVYNPTVAPDGSPTAYDIAERAMVLLQGKPNGVNLGAETNTDRFYLDANALGPLPPTKAKAYLDAQLLLINTIIDLAA